MSTFGWCASGKHKECIQKYAAFFIDPKGKVVYTGEERTCQCSKRGCACFVPAKDRDKTTKRRRK